MFCSIPDVGWYSNPEAGISYFNSNNYKSFEDKLNNIITMDDDKYRELTKSNSRYMIVYDPKRSSCDLIRKDILSGIN